MPHQHVVDECTAIYEGGSQGAMSDAAKRQRDFQEPEDEVNEWDRVSLAEGQISSYASYAAAGKGSAPSAPEPVKPGIKVPDGMTVTQWGMSLCKI